jgi:hypothetical protein
VAIRQSGRELARVTVGTTLSTHVIPVTINAGHTEVEFTTDTPPIREGDGPGARELGFALYDPQLVLPKS